MFITSAFANTGAQAPSLLGQFAPLVIIFIIFYFLLIRPQQKRQKEHKAKLSSIVKGSIVITAGGIKGKVTKESDTELTVEIAKGVTVTVIRSTVLGVEEKK